VNAPEKMTHVAQAAHSVASPSDFDRLLQREWSPRDMLEGDSMAKMWQMAEAMANSRVSVPEHLRGNIGDCMAICTQAMLWNMNPFAVAQKTHIVSGRLGYEAQLVIAVVQNSGAIRGAFRFEHDGDKCRAGAVLRGDTEVTWGEWLSASGVATKNSPLWKTNPKQQMSYLQAKNWSRIYCPGAILGVYSTDELEDSPITATAPAPRASASSGRTELPGYTAEEFDAKLPAWAKLVTGRDGKTASALLTKLSTKAAFTEEQRARILALKPATEDATPAAAPAPAAGEHDDFVADMNAAEGAAQ
jgi:hypothetical protein